MLRKRRHNEDDDRGRRRRHGRGESKSRERSLSARAAYCVLIGGGVLILTRASVATLIQVHGDGMAPTILDGESVVLIRGTWGIEAGDVVIYDPTPPQVACEDEAGPPDRRDPSPGLRDGGAPVSDAREARGELHDVSVVDVDDVENNWARVQDRKLAQPRNFRVGRVLAVPGDRVTFQVPGVALGLVINGTPLQQKADDPIRLVLADEPAPGEDRSAAEAPKLRPFAWETLGDARYPILLGSGEPTWAGMELPTDLGPLEFRAEGYLILADNRDEGACCDSRALGWIPVDKLRGEVVFRLPGDPSASPDSDPEARGLARLP